MIVAEAALDGCTLFAPRSPKTVDLKIRPIHHHLADRVIDVRPRKEYAAGHVPSALSILLAELESIHPIWRTT